jgi:GT2 family glycosyltransferase
MECLAAVLNQTRKVDKIILINNASTDGTVEALEENGYLANETISLINMESNTGGSGGFYEGMRQSLDVDCDWVWIMDDDTIPDANSLEELLAAKDKVDPQASFYASTVFGPEGEPMNVPHVSEQKAPNGYMDWYRHLGESCVEISEATFVSLLINRKAIEKCGLPCKDYFLWGDDYEYTMRIVRHFGKAYFVGKSRVCHKRFGATNLDVRKETAEGRIKLYYYFYRNGLINRKIYSSKSAWLRFALGGVRTSLTSLKTKYGWKKCCVVYQGIFGYFKHYKKFQKYIEQQIK